LRGWVQLLFDQVANQESEERRGLIKGLPNADLFDAGAAIQRTGQIAGEFPGNCQHCVSLWKHPADCISV